jgi:hypothetical protein
MLKTRLDRYARPLDALPEPVAELKADFDVVARNGYRRQVSCRMVEAVTDVAGDTALL